MVRSASTFAVAAILGVVSPASGGCNIGNTANDGWRYRSWEEVNGELCLTPDSENIGDPNILCHNPDLSSINITSVPDQLKSPGVARIGVSWTFGVPDIPPAWLRAQIKSDDSDLVSIGFNTLSVTGDSGQSTIEVNISAGENTSRTYKVLVYIGLNSSVRFCSSLDHDNANNNEVGIPMIAASTITTSEPVDSTSSSFSDSTSDTSAFATIIDTSSTFSFVVETTESSTTMSSTPVISSTGVSTETIAAQLTLSAAATVSVNSTVEGNETGSEDDDSSATVWITVVCVVVILLIVLAATVLYIRKQRSIQHSPEKCIAGPISHGSASGELNMYASVDETHCEVSASPRFSYGAPVYALPDESTPPPAVLPAPDAAQTVVRNLQYTLPQDADINMHHGKSSDTLDASEHILMEKNVEYGVGIDHNEITYSEPVFCGQEGTEIGKSGRFYAVPQTGARPYSPDLSSSQTNASEHQVVYNSGLGTDSEGSAHTPEPTALYSVPESTQGIVPSQRGEGQYALPQS